MSEREELRARPKAAQAAQPEGLRQDEHATRVLACCDGRRDVAELSKQLSLSPEQVWAALDRLADAGLLVERASPPSATAALAMGALGSPLGEPMSAPMSRRDALGALSTGLLAGGALLSAGLTWPTLAYAQEDALAKDSALEPVTPTPEEAQALAQEVTLDGTVETSQRRVQERQLKAQHAERRVKEQDAKHKEAVRCQERHAKARSKDAPSCAQDAKRLQEEHHKAQQDGRQKRQAEQSAKREHQSLVKRRAEEDAKAKERERHMKKKGDDGERRVQQEADAKRSVNDR